MDHRVVPDLLRCHSFGLDQAGHRFSSLTAQRAGTSNFHEEGCTPLQESAGKRVRIHLGCSSQSFSGLRKIHSDGYPVDRNVARAEGCPAVVAIPIEVIGRLCRLAEKVTCLCSITGTRRHQRASQHQ